ncbi:hypothetical protein [Veillonella nakazawae]|uniref:hypothetical protein n=1 Tax=Veillonella nakazawae TaxID=2682456 RepID=UPI0039957CBA
MIKKLVKIICAIYILGVGLFFSKAYAISLNELQSNSQFILVESREKTSSYINQYSIQSIRYEPPYYSLKYTSYIVSYEKQEILMMSGITNYNTNFSSSSIINRYPELGDDEKSYIRIMEMKKANPGIIITYMDCKAYDFEGNLKYEKSNYQLKNGIKFLSPLYAIGDKAFNLYYKQGFEFLN